MKLYTKTGDKGQTGLVGGQRVSKSTNRIDLYGEVDELNSSIGLVTSFLDKNQFDEETNFIQEIQSSLFDLGSNLACLKENRESFKLPSVNKEDVKKLEKYIDKLEVHCPKLKNFILPGGHQAASSAHLARTVCRRVERKLVSFSEQEELPEYSLEYINRLSDFLFIFARFINVTLGENEVVWKSR